MQVTDMAKNDNLTDFLQDIADTIRAKRGITGSINAQNFATEIAAIEGGGTPTPTPPTPDIPVIGDGKTYLYIKIVAPGRMKVPLYFSQTVANGVTIDWGDGSATQTLSGTGNKNTTHTYAEIGEYTISLNPSSSCTLGLGRNASNYCVLGSTGNDGKVYCNMLQAVEIGRNITSIGYNAFYGCFSLSSVVIPEGVTSIGNYAFGYCHSLPSIVIPEGVTSISDSVFRECYSLSSIVIPESVTSIGNNVFRECRSLSSIVIPESVTSIDFTAFAYCRSLSSIVIPEGITSIGNNTFEECQSLPSIVIPEGVASIGSYAFSKCYSLSSIVIPESVTSIGNYAFQYCYGMAFYDFSQCTSVPTLGGSYVFSNIPSDCKIVVPDNLYDTWIATTNWSTHASKIVKASEFNS